MIRPSPRNTRSNRTSQVLYACAIFAVEMIGRRKVCPGGSEHLSENEMDKCPDVFDFPNYGEGGQEQLFGGVTAAMLTLFICVTQGCGDSVMRPVVTQDPSLVIFFIIFIFLTTYGIINLIVSGPRLLLLLLLFFPELGPRTVTGQVILENETVFVSRSHTS